MSVAPENNNPQNIDPEKSPADEETVETENARYAVYKLGEEVTGYSDFAKGEVIGPGDGKLLNLETEKKRYSLRPQSEGKAIEVYQPEGVEYSLVIQRTDDLSAEEVPEQDRREIRETLEALE